MVLQGTLASSVQRPTWNLSSPQMCVMGRQREGDRKEGKITEQEQQLLSSSGKEKKEKETRERLDIGAVLLLVV